MDTTTKTFIVKITGNEPDLVAVQHLEAAIEEGADISWTDIDVSELPD